MTFFVETKSNRNHPTYNSQSTYIYSHKQSSSKAKRRRQIERKNTRERVSDFRFVLLMAAKKTWSLKKVMRKERSWFSSLKKVMSKENSVWPSKISNAFKWKRLDFHVDIVDELAFKIMYVVEAFVLVSTVCFFFLCFGCSF